MQTTRKKKFRFMNSAMENLPQNSTQDRLRIRRGRYRIARPRARADPKADTVRKPNGENQAEDSEAETA